MTSLASAMSTALLSLVSPANLLRVNTYSCINKSICVYIYMYVYKISCEVFSSDQIFVSIIFFLLWIMEEIKWVQG